MDDPAFKWTTAIRDLPVDYSILVENILDPDHGLFAHQAAPFDLYTATRDAPQTVAVDESSPGFFSLSSAVAAVPKLVTTMKKEIRQPGTVAGTTLYGAQNVTGVSTFRPPSAIATGRRDAAGATKFQQTFWLCPTGVGRTRFMAAGVGRLTPKKPAQTSRLKITRNCDDGFKKCDSIYLFGAIRGCV